MLIILRQFKLIVVIISAVIISTLGIFASDELNGISTRLSGLVIGSSNVCDNNTTLIAFGSYAVCMDNYEASPSVNCLHSEPKNEMETKANIAHGNCKAESQPSVLPWRFVQYTEAQQLCSRSGKRLITNDEWYRVALGLENPDNCFSSNSEVGLTGSNNCLTPDGIHDLVGNLWEWMNDVTEEGKYKGRQLPDSGYVDLVGPDGIVLETSSGPNNTFGSDYAWVNKEGMRGILRGGFYGSGSDGGIFAQNMTVTLDFSAAGIGFRCVRDLVATNK